MFSSIGIEKTLTDVSNKNEYKIKEKIEDFIVQEVVGNIKCIIQPVVDFKKFTEAEQLFESLADCELSKEQRKEIYTLANYHPFKRLVTRDNKLVVEEKENDIFVCTLLKYDYSSNAVINLLAKRLNIHQSNIQMGGTKDKRGITLQEISINCKGVDLLKYAFTLAKNPSLKIGLLGYSSSIDNENDLMYKELIKYQSIEELDVNEQILLMNIRRGGSKKLGALNGNYFTIKIRGYFNNQHPEFINFLNYFGNQRFGMYLNNHIVGELILEEKYDEALDMIVGNDDAYNPVQKQVLRMREQGQKGQYIYKSIPRHVKMIYLHAYQSFIFNNEINKRISTNSPLQGTDKKLINDKFEDLDGSETFNDVYIPLKKMEDKLLKGGYRKMIETIQNLSCTVDEDGTSFSFYLNKSSYATVALREIIGDIIKPLE